MSGLPQRVLVAGGDGLHRSAVGRRARRGWPSGAVHGPTPEKLDAESWRAQVQVVTSDVLDRTSPGGAFDVDAAYYLVHSIGS